MQKIKRMKSIVSVFLIAVILAGFVPVTTVKASEANYMSSQMINFFKDINDISDVNTLSPDEIRVYAVFITNFMKPGQFIVDDLKGGTDTAFVKSIGSMFFGESVDTETLATIVKLNTIVYNTITDDLAADGKCDLYAEKDSSLILTGKELMNKMMTTVPDTDKDIATIYYGKDDRAVCMDLHVSAIRGAFKILSAYSVDFMLGENGIANMSALYIDGFGNIWGAFEENLAIGERKITTATAKNKLKLVMPACINPLAFTSFADSEINGTTAPTQISLKLPLNNAFAMGAFVNTSSMSADYKENIVPYYNIYSYFEDEKDLVNLLNIYGISSPLASVLNSNAATTTDLDFSSNLTKFFNNGLTTIYPSSTFIVLANNMANVEKKLEGYTQEIKGITSKAKMIDYLFSTMKISTSKVADTLYYFGETNQDVDWKTEFSDLGMLGASLFTNVEGEFYGSNANTNGVTTQLNTFYTDLGTMDITSKNADLENLKILKEAAEILGKAFNDKSTAKVAVLVPKKYANLVFLLSKLDASGSNFAAISAEFADTNEDYTTTTAFEVTIVHDVTPTISALCYLIGASTGEYSETGATQRQAYYYSPSLFDVGSTVDIDDKDKISPKTEVAHNYGLKDADKDSYTKLSTKKFIFNLGNKEYIYSLGSDDNKVKNILTEEVHEITITTPDAYNQLFTTFNVYTLFSPLNIGLSTSITNNKVTFKIGDTDVTYNVNNFIADEANNWHGMFFGYLVDILQMDIASTKATEKAQAVDENATDKFDCYSFESSFLPSANIDVTGGKLDLSSIASESGVSSSDEKTMEDMQKDLIKKIYGIVSDTTNEYRNSWLKSTLDGFLLTIHRNITGSWLSNMYTVSSGSGSTYQGVVGYISTPSLNDLSFTSWFMTNYMQIYAFMLLLVAIFLVLMVLVKMRTWRQGSAIFMFMCLALLLPNILLGNTINITNKVTDSVFSDKFDFWAMTQHYQAIKSLEGTNNPKDAVIVGTFQQAEDTYSSDAGVRIKWMAPKKTDTFNSLYTSTDMSDSFATNLTIFKWLFSSFIYESDFVDSDPLATYVYRSYNSIATTGKEYYAMGLESIMQEDADTGVRSAGGSDDKISKSVKFTGTNGKIQTVTVKTYDYMLDIYKLAKKSERATDYDTLFYAALVDDNLFKKTNFTDIYYDIDKIADIDKVDTWNYNSVSDSVALWGMGSVEVNNIMFTKAEVSTSGAPTVGVTSTLGASILADMDQSDANTTAFLLNTESPYYYFYNTLKYRYGSKGNFKSSLLDRDIFIVRDVDLVSTVKSANGEIRDFLDLEGMFTYMIPYLTVCNDYVYDWTSLNGTNIASYNFGNNDDVDVKASEEYKNQSQLKREMQNVWNMYTPWVDQLNSLDVNNKKVTVGTKKVKIQNTLNPSYYLLQGRPMIFSEADMVAKGYKVSSLTDVEIRMQKVLEDTYSDLMYLVNYYDMDNEVLLSAAAMYAVFNFNKEFSQTSLLGESVMLYPQNFEMKNFNHDAYLRLTLLNSTGETIFSDTDLFERVLAKTSVFTGVLLLVEDVVAIIAIPTLKFFVLLLLFFLGLLLCVAFTLMPPDKIVNCILKTLVLPSALFMTASVAFAYAVSFLMGDGLTSYVGSDSLSIATNDPTITILMLIVINVIYVIVLLELIKMMFKSFKSYGLASVFAGIGLVQDFASKGVSKAFSMVNGGIKKSGELVGKATNTALSTAAGGIVGGKDGAWQGLVKGLKGRKALDTLDYELGKKRNDAAMRQSGFGGGGTSGAAFIPKADMKAAIDTKSNSYNDAINNLDTKVDYSYPANTNLANTKPAKVEQQSSIGGRALSIPGAIGLGTAGGLKIAGQYMQKGARGVNVAARVGCHYTKEGAKAVGSGVVEGAKAIGSGVVDSAKMIGQTTKAGVNLVSKGLDTAGNYISNHSVAEMSRVGAKLVGNGVYGAGKVIGRGAIATGKLAVKPVLYTGKAIGNYALKSGRDAKMLNQSLSNSINTKYNELYKENHGYVPEINDGAKTVTNHELEKAEKIKRNFDNNNQGRANREAWEIINKWDASRKG